MAQIQIIPVIHTAFIGKSFLQLLFLEGLKTCKVVLNRSLPNRIPTTPKKLRLFVEGLAPPHPLLMLAFGLSRDPKWVPK